MVLGVAWHCLALLDDLLVLLDGPWRCLALLDDLLVLLDGAWHCLALLDVFKIVDVFVLLHEMSIVVKECS